MQKTIMTIDDSRAVRLSISLALKQAGYQVMEAADGREALGILEKTKVDLIISDLNMPEIDGIQLTRLLRAESVNSKTPILIVTTEQMKGQLQAGKEAGATGWIYKPVKVEKLLIAVRTVFERFP